MKYKYRYKWNKDPIKCRIGEITNGNVISYQVATNGDFRKGYITFTKEEFEKMFERY